MFSLGVGLYVSTTQLHQTVGDTSCKHKFIILAICQQFGSKGQGETHSSGGFFDSPDAMVMAGWLSPKIVHKTECLTMCFTSLVVDEARLAREGKRGVGKFQRL